MTINITREQARIFASRACQARGDDYVYEPEYVEGTARCLYWSRERDKPGCIVGMALHFAGVSPDILKAMDGLDRLRDGSFPGSSIGEEYSTRVLIENEVHLTLGARRFFEVLQRRQDIGKTWGTAIASAIIDTHGGEE